MLRMKPSDLCVTAFYQNCWEADLGIIERVDFEAQLESHYRSPASKIDPAWFALRNIVLAGGYRSLLAKDHTVSFSTAQAEAGSYYKKALSVFTRLLLPPSNTTAIRALALMVRDSSAGCGQHALELIYGRHSIAKR